MVNAADGGRRAWWQAVLSLWGTLLLLVAGCEPDPLPSPAPAASSPAAKASGSAASSAPKPIPANAVKVVVAYGSEKKTWLEKEADAFNATEAKTKSGRSIVVELQAGGSGELATAIVSGSSKPTVFSPASGLYVTQLNEAWSDKTKAAKALCPPGEPLVLSPIVVAIWKPMAEALGWPAKSISWSDLIKINDSKDGWGALKHPEWGRFKLGHTHPEYSNSGLQAIVAEAYAGAKKTRGLTAADLEKKEVVAKIKAIENTIVHYGKSTGFFADKMLERGPSFLSAAVLYENLVIESYGKTTSAPFPIVAVYPSEGTFWSDHPYAVLDAEWVGAEEREGADAFLKFLKAKPAQEHALALGFRPADPSIAIGSPIDAAHGVDPKQPQTLLEQPDAATLKKLIEVWQTAKKASDVIVVFDTSGSMKGEALRQAKDGAKAFVRSLHDNDEVSLVFFNSQVFPAVGPFKLAKSRADIDKRIDDQIADGKTALYDATEAGYKAALARAEKDPGRIHAVLVMTDGKDTSSNLDVDALLKRVTPPPESTVEVRVFTIAYGSDADPKVLARIAEAAKGTSSKGSTSDIIQVYRDMAAFF